VGTLLEVGLSKIEPIELKRILESKDREKAGETIEAKGLFLTEVHYK
ncbi:MAG TPA: tRNA pseudouridine(38-40) synthase TruA, partial [Lachnoclostridium phytofermentans]|nr:tRNA pseudouridine(38-40) synthase TruA [Lachnoclostridium phytofermentans]